MSTHVLHMTRLHAKRPLLVELRVINGPFEGGCRLQSGGGAWLACNTSLRYVAHDTRATAREGRDARRGRGVWGGRAWGVGRAGGCVFDSPGFTRDFDSFDSENEWDGKVVFVGF